MATTSIRAGRIGDDHQAPEGLSQHSNPELISEYISNSLLIQQQPTPASHGAMVSDHEKPSFAAAERAATAGPHSQDSQPQPGTATVVAESTLQEAQRPVSADSGEALAPSPFATTGHPSFEDERQGEAFPEQEPMTREESLAFGLTKPPSGQLLS